MFYVDSRVSSTSPASALDPASRTLPTEVLIGNGEGRLLPGMYVQIRFSVPRAVSPVLIPASALVTRTEGARVIVIRPDGTTHYQPVEVGRDYGSRLGIIDGLNAGEMVVTSPTDALREGGRVEARPAPPPPGNSQGVSQTAGTPQSNTQSGEGQQGNSSAPPDNNGVPQGRSGGTQ